MPLGNCECKEIEYDRYQNRSFCIECGLESISDTASWALTHTDVIKIKESIQTYIKQIEEGIEAQLPIKSNHIGKQRYNETVDYIFNKLSIF